MRITNTAILFLFVACSAFAQETHDFSRDAHTTTIAVSFLLPGRCSYGELRQIYQATPSVATIYQCGYSNDWHAFAGGGGSMVWPTTAGVMVYQGGSAYGTSLTAGTGNNNLFQLGGSGWGGVCNGNTLDCTNPGQLDVNPTVIPNLVNTQTPTNFWDYRTASATAPNRLVTGAPPYGTCNSTNVGQTASRSEAGASNSSFYMCNETGASTYTWELIGGSSGSGLPIYNTTGTALTGSPHVVVFQLTNAGYSTMTQSLTGSSAFTSQPSCFSTNISDGSIAATQTQYCTAVTSLCTAASTGTTLYFNSSPGSWNVECIGN